MHSRILLVLQLLGTLAILAWVPTNLVKTVAFVLLWLLTFRRVAWSELLLYAMACGFFTVMDVATVQANQFGFRAPDILGLPIYEPFMWGFYLLHTKRMLGGPIPAKVDSVTWLLVALFAVPFLAVRDPMLLFVSTAAVLLAAFYFHHERYDLSYFGYMVVLGGLVEYVGVFTDQWYYPTDPPTGVPLWFVTMWGGIGLFLRRLVLPRLVGLDRGSLP